MGVSLNVFVEIGYAPTIRDKSATQPMTWSTVIRVQWFRNLELYRLMGRPSSDDGWVMYPLRGLPPDISDEVKECIKDGGLLQNSWLTVQELIYLQEALAYPEDMPEVHATVAFVKEYQKQKHDTTQLRIVYGFSQ